MGVDELMQVVGTLGFPIAMCGAMFWYMIKQTEAHKEETRNMTEALNNNTIALTELKAKIGESGNGQST